MGPTVKTSYNPYDRYCSVQAQIGDALAIETWKPSVIHRTEIFPVNAAYRSKKIVVQDDNAAAWQLFDLGR